MPVLVLLQAPDSEVRPLPRFVDVAAQSGLALVNVNGDLSKDYILEANGNGGGFFDYDNDRDLDVLIANGSTLDRMATGGTPMLALYRNDGDGFTEVTDEAGLGATGWGMGVCIADYDNDGDRDVYLTAYGPNVMYRNDGNGHFTDVTSGAGTGDTRWGTSCAFSDYDRDGDVDLYVANYLRFDDSVPARGESAGCRYLGMDVFCGPRGLVGEPDRLYRNNGDGSFTDVSIEAGIIDPGYYGFGVVFSDLDNDGWSDIYVANDSVPNFLFRNDQDGTFTEIGLLSGTSLSGTGIPQAGMGVAVADYDGDGYFDIYVTNFAQDTNTLYRNLGGWLFEDATQSSGLALPSMSRLGWGTGFFDLDNDSWLDLFVANGHVYPEIDRHDLNQSYMQRNSIYRNMGGLRFSEITENLGADLARRSSRRGVAFADYDSDGDVDVLTINMNENPSLFRNDGGNRKHWISFRLDGTLSNRDAIGARIEIDAGGRTRVGEVRSGGSYLSENALCVFFGLDEESQVSATRVYWPSGAMDEVGRIKADQQVTIREGEGVIDARTPPHSATESRRPIQ